MKYYSRKTTRLPYYNYSGTGYYFVTLCTKKKCKILGEVVGTGLLDGPKVQLSSFGETANKQLALMADFYDTIKLEGRFLQTQKSQNLWEHLSVFATGSMARIYGRCARMIM